MSITLTEIHGFSDLPDSIFEADNPAFGDMVQAIAENAEFAFARMEVFQGVYADGDTVSLPVSPIDDYQYSQDELIYFYTVVASTDRTSGWITGKDTLWFANWFVNQATGEVLIQEWYRRSGENADAVSTSDGQLLVFTIAQRQKQNIIVAASPSYSAISGGAIATDEPFNQTLAQALNDDAKFAAINKEIFYCGEFINGQQIPRGGGSALISPADGYQYQYSECKFLHCWRWTTAGSAYAQPSESNGQLGPTQASIDATGNVSITVKMIDDSGNLNTISGYGRIAAFAFCTRSTTPSSLSLANAFAEQALDTFASGKTLRASNLLQLENNILESLLTPEFFGPTSHANGDTISLPVSPVDGYTYARSELTYLWTWSDTTPQTGSNLRVALFYGSVNPTTGVLTLNVWRLPPGAALVDDNNTLCRANVLVMARRGQPAQPPITVPTNSPGDVSTTTIEEPAPPYAITFDMGGGRTQVPGTSESLLKHVIPANLVSVILPASLTGSVAKCRTAPTGSYSITINKNGSSIGSINFAASSTSATFTFASIVTLAPGDIVEFVGGTADATILGIFFTLSGTRT